MAAALLAAPAPSPDGHVRILVAAGADIGLAGEPPLQHAAEDARRFSEVLGRLGGVEPARQVLLTAPDAAALELALDRGRQLAAAAAPAPVTFVFYYSGHGDAAALHLGGDRLPMSRVEALVEAVPARLRVTVVDACRSADRDKGLAAGQPFHVDLARPGGAAGSLRLFASADGEAARESDSLGGAVFTHALVSALAGAGDANGDRLVTLAEAYDHAFAQTLRRSAVTAGPLQHPVLDADLAAEGAVVLTRLDASPAVLLLPAVADEQYLVFARPAGTLVAESWSDPARPRPLALPTGRFLVQRRSSRAAGALEVSLGAGETVALSAGAFEERPLLEVAAKGGRLRLHPHRISAGAGLLATTDGALGPAIQAGYRHRWASFGLGFEATVARLEDDLPSDALTEDSLQLAAVADWILEFEHVELAAGTGLAGRATFQELVAHDASRWRAAGLDPVEEKRGLGGGLQARVEAALPLGRWRAGLHLTANGLLVRDTDGLAPRLDLLAGLGVGLNL